MVELIKVTSPAVRKAQQRWQTHVARCDGQGCCAACQNQLAEDDAFELELILYLESLGGSTADFHDFRAKLAADG